MLSPAKPLITTFWFYHIKHLIITKLELFFLSVYPACNLLLQSSLCGHSALNQRSSSVEAFAGSLLTWEERRSDSFDLKSVKSLFVSVKVWIICFDLMWFERSTVFVQQVSWSWIYHTKGLFDVFFQLNLRAGSLPHVRTQNISVWTARVRWGSDIQTWRESFWEITLQKISSLRWTTRLFYRGSFRRGREASRVPPRSCGLFQSSSSSSLSLICSFPTHQLCIPATGWTRRGKLDPEVTSRLGSKTCRQVKNNVESAGICVVCNWGEWI